MKITREDIKRFDDIRLIVLSALLGTALAKFDLDPSSIAAPFVALTFIMSVIMAAYGVHTISTNSNKRNILAELWIIFFVFGMLLLVFLSHVLGSDVISGFIGIDGSGMFLILMTILVWLLTSLIVKLGHHHLETAAEDTATKVVEKDE
jgi:predicted membrane metal-binding protein